MKALLIVIFGVILMTGCAKVSIENPMASYNAKQFNSPSEGKAGLYIYRSSPLGFSLKKDIWVNGECVGRSASGVFFYYEVPGEKEYSIATESEFSPNEWIIKVESGKNYFIEQFIKPGLFIGGADLVQVKPEEAKSKIQQLKMARNGLCKNMLYDYQTQYNEYGEEKILKMREQITEEGRMN